MGGGGEFEFAAADAGVEGDFAVAGRLVVFDGGGVGEADFGVVGWLEAGDEGAGAVALAFVVVVADGGRSVSFVWMICGYLGEWREVGLPFKVLPRAGAVFGYAV